MLIDAGCELEGYASDVTRTYPVGGRFTGAGARALRGGARARSTARARAVPARRDAARDPRRRACARWSRACVELGLLAGDLDGPDRARGLPALLHALDQPLARASTCTTSAATARTASRARLEPGMVFTVEPGLYVLAATTRTRRAALPRHRRPHRGRRADHGERPREPDRRDPQGPRRARGRCVGEGR